MPNESPGNKTLLRLPRCLLLSPPVVSLTSQTHCNNLPYFSVAKLHPSILSFFQRNCQATKSEGTKTTGCINFNILCQMNYWKHSLLSKKKFNGAAEDYLAIHKFLDTSKLFFFDLRHRILLHHTYGIDLCIEKFGEMIINSDNQKILIRDIAAEHCKEDMMGVVPTLNNWFKYVDDSLLIHITPIQPADAKLKEFVLRPLLMSGLRASLIITHSNFGVWLAKELLGIDYGLELAKHVEHTNINELIPYIKLREKWQFTSDINQLKDIEDEFSPQALGQGSGKP